jgi:hypothetical protein
MESGHEEIKPATPAHLFACLWRNTMVLTASQRANSWRPPIQFHQTAIDMAGMEDPGLGVEALQVLLKGPTSELIGRQLAVMVAIDNLFAALHPRTPRATAIPGWMSDLQDHRTVSGFYLEAEGMVLLPRGPLLRIPRDPDASSADTLEDRFTYLTAFSNKLSERDMPIGVNFKYIGTNLLDGVEPICNPGRERISFVPIAETVRDLEIKPITLNNKIFAKYGPSATLAGGQRIIDALSQHGRHELTVAPELVMSPDQTAYVQDGLRMANTAPNLLLLGTQNSEDNENGQPFNEALLVNSMGTLLSRQRKIWPASIPAARARELKLCGDNDHSSVSENNASSREIDIIDIDGFGRVVVLICQDFMLEVAYNLIARLQPDWVLVPILDHNLDCGRWAHRRALAISETAQSRFVSVTSTALACPQDDQDLTVKVGFALGPAVPTSTEEKQRAVVFINVDRTASPYSGITTWHGPEWTQTFVRTN